MCIRDRFDLREHQDNVTGRTASCNSRFRDWNDMQRSTQQNRVRCPWAATEPNLSYHDEEWGRPVHDDRTLFEFLVLEGAQAGLSWWTVLRKREAYRKAFDGFDPERVARFRAARVAALLRDPGIIRNRAKVASAVENAKAFLEVQR